MVLRSFGFGPRRFRPGKTPAHPSGHVRGRSPTALSDASLGAAPIDARPRSRERLGSRETQIRLKSPTLRPIAAVARSALYLWVSLTTLRAVEPMPFLSRVFFAIACFFRLIFDGRFAAAVEQTKALPPTSPRGIGKTSGAHSDRGERHAIPPTEVAADADHRDTDLPPTSSRARDTIDDLVRKTPADDDDDDMDDSNPSISTESHNTGLRRRSPPKPTTVPPPADDGSTESGSPPTEPSPGTLPPPPPGETSSAHVAVDVDSVAELPPAENVAHREEPVATLQRDTTADASPTVRQTMPPAAESGYAPRERGALLLLALLQREGRFVDFLQQDVTDFDDEQIGAAARVVHEGCRKALKGHLEIAPIRSEAEGDNVTLPEGYDVQANKLVGNVSGKPPYKGSVQHRGWRAQRLQLPSEVGNHDPSVLAQAEVEL